MADQNSSPPSPSNHCASSPGEAPPAIANPLPHPSAAASTVPLPSSTRQEPPRSPLESRYPLAAETVNSPPPSSSIAADCNPVLPSPRYGQPMILTLGGQRPMITVHRMEPQQSVFTCQPQLSDFYVIVEDAVPSTSFIELRNSTGSPVRRRIDRYILDNIWVSFVETQPPPSEANPMTSLADLQLEFPERRRRNPFGYNLVELNRESEIMALYTLLRILDEVASFLEERRGQSSNVGPSHSTSHYVWPSYSTSRYVGPSSSSIRDLQVPTLTTLSENRRNSIANFMRSRESRRINLRQDHQVPEGTPDSQLVPQAERERGTSISDNRNVGPHEPSSSAGDHVDDAPAT